MMNESEKKIKLVYIVKVEETQQNPIIYTNIVVNPAVKFKYIQGDWTYHPGTSSGSSQLPVPSASPILNTVPMGQPYSRACPVLRETPCKLEFSLLSQVTDLQDRCSIFCSRQGARAWRMSQSCWLHQQLDNWNLLLPLK